MKITALDTVVVHAEMRNWVFVKVSTDEGLVGWGEATVEWKTTTSRIPWELISSWRLTIERM